MYALTHLGQVASSGNCSGWESDPESFSKRVAEHYVRTVLGQSLSARRIAPYYPSGNKKFMEVQFSPSLAVGVSFVKIPDYVIALRLRAQPPGPPRYYTYTCNREGNLVLSERKPSSAAPQTPRSLKMRGPLGEAEQTAGWFGQPANYPVTHPELKIGSRGLTAGVLSPQSEQAPRVIVSGFSRYVREARALPPEEQKKIDSLARRIVEHYRPGRRPIRTIHFVGHADRDTPRRPAFEQRISEERALEIKDAVLSSVDRQADFLLLGPVFPPISQRLSFQIIGKGATQLAVPNAMAERERARNRRVEVFVHLSDWNSVVATETVSRIHPARFRNVIPRSTPSLIEMAIQDFCARGKADEIDQKGLRKNCFAAVSAAARNLGCKSPLADCCKLSLAASQLVTSKKYHDQCNKNANGRFLEVTYQPLAKVVKQLQCALDSGCVVKAGVLSGICDDKPDLGCKARLEKRQQGHLVWQDCPEHWILIFGHDPSRDEFVFYDSAGASAMSPCGLSSQVGLLQFDSTENRLTTALKNVPGGVDHMEVNPAGFHVNQNVRDIRQSSGDILRLSTQKRYQVLTLRACLL